MRLSINSRRLSRWRKASQSGQRNPTRSSIYLSIHIYIHTHTHIDIYIYIYVVYIYIVYIYIYIYIYIYNVYMIVYR